MALSIVADSNSAPALPGIETSSRWFCDAYTGSADALVAAGIVTREQLEPQKGRPEGRMVFLPHGEPCPTNRKAWREPGYKSIWRQEDGTYLVELTAPKEVQAARRKVLADEEHEREQLRINQEIEESGDQYRDWKLQHGFSSSFGYAGEWWEGTKAQLQGVGIGVGMVFPGEPGGPEDLHCKCPLGFDVRVYLPSGYDRAKAAARIYKASSPYVPYREEPKQYVQHAPGVVREVWQPDSWRGSDSFSGTAAALVAAGLVPSLDMFPGQPGRNKGQASYQLNGKPATSSPHRNVTVSIRKHGKGDQFTVTVPVSAAEEKRRGEVRDQHKKQQEERNRALALERQKLRELSSGVTVEEFRTKRAEDLETWMQLLWRSVFLKADGILSYDLPEGSEAWEGLAEAFQTLRDLVQNAPVHRDAKLQAKLLQQQMLTAARNDEGLQSLLQNAKGLSLVHSTRDS